MTSFLTRTFGGAVLLAAATSCQPAAAQTMNDGNISLSASCDDLSNVEGRKLCQGAFEVFTSALLEQTTDIVNEPRAISYGSMDNPIMITTPMQVRETYATKAALNGVCQDIAVKKPGEKNSMRLDDGSETGLLRIATRAVACADTAQLVAEVTKGPMVFNLIAAIRQNAEEVIPQVNRIVSSATNMAMADLSAMPVPVFKRH